MRAYRPIADRRRQLIDAGIAIGEREGVAAVTARRVASEAGVSLGLVSYCFATKDDLTVAMAARIAEDTAEAADAPLDLTPPPVPALVPVGGEAAPTAGPPPGHRSADRASDLEFALQAALNRLWQLHEATPGRQLLTYEITTRALREPRLNDVAQQQYDSTVNSCCLVLDHVADQVGVTWDRNVQEMADLVVMAVDGATLRWLVDKDSAAALRRLGDIARLLATMAH
jgi:AcrR family transcriptional regulator